MKLVTILAAAAALLLASCSRTPLNDLNVPSFGMDSLKKNCSKGGHCTKSSYNYGK